MKYFTVLSLVIVAALPVAAHAEEGEGFYIAARAGVQSVSDVPFTADSDVYDLGPTETIGGTFQTDSAAGFAVALGYDFGMIRSDIEVTYGKNDVPSITVSELNGTALTSDLATEGCAYFEEGCTAGTNSFSLALQDTQLRQVSAMASVWLDVPVGQTIVPYVGGGIGISGYHIAFEDEDDDGTAKFAWQLGAGVAVNISSNLALTLDYRHREVSGDVLFEDGEAYFDFGKFKTDQFGGGVRVTF